MIVNEIYSSAGFGNQIFMAVATRCIASDLGFDYGIAHPERFKGQNFMDFDFGKSVKCSDVPDVGFSSVLPKDINHYYKEELVRNEYGVDISPADKKLYSIRDNTKIDGHFQSVSYLKHHQNKIVEWLKVKDLKQIHDYENDNDCIIHLRGNDYINSPSNTLLPLEYYLNAMEYMRSKNPSMRFYVVTDDLNLAQFYFRGIATIVGSTAMMIPDPYKCAYHKGGLISVDYSILNNAKNIIMSNSSFAWWAAWTNMNLRNIIAPFGWMGFNWDQGFWSTGDIRVKEWDYLDKKGVIHEGYR